MKIDNPGESNYSKHSKKQQEELKSKREAVKMSPFWFRISFDHNHGINIAEHQRFRTVSKETKDAFTELFEDDLTASAAWDKHRKKIKDENPDSWPILLGDRSICPDYFWCFYFYQQWCRSRLGTRDGIDAVEKLEDFVRGHNKKLNQGTGLEKPTEFIKTEQSPSGETVIVICDPFMRRVHAVIPQSGDLVLLDATSNLDRSDSKLFHFVTPSSIG